MIILQTYVEKSIAYCKMEIMGREDIHKIICINFDSKVPTARKR
jgi:uncharacterized protein with von Willebrand factor type A (vWA) domain